MRGFCTLIVLSCCLALPQIGLAQIADLSVDDLVKQLADSDVNRRRDAAYELVRRQDTSEAVVLAFATATADSDIQVRFQSLMGLARSGKAAEPAINELIRCLADRDDQIRFRAADALGKIGVGSLQPILDKWPHGSLPAKVAASQALEILGPEAKPAMPVLTEALKEKGDLARFAAAAMVAISPDDEAAILPSLGTKIARCDVLVLPRLPRLAILQNPQRRSCAMRCGTTSPRFVKRPSLPWQSLIWRLLKKKC